MLQVFYAAIGNYFEDPKRAFNREKQQWPCYRAKKTVNENICKQCQSCEHTRKNMRKYSESIQGVFANHWSNEPCVFECGMDLDREEYLSLDESVKNNSWYTEDEKCKAALNRPLTVEESIFQFSGSPNVELESK